MRETGDGDRRISGGLRGFFKIPLHLPPFLYPLGNISFIYLKQYVKVLKIPQIVVGLFYAVLAIKKGGRKFCYTKE